MSNEQAKKIIEHDYDDSKEDTLRSMVSDFYSRKLLSTAILVWAWGIIFFALAVYSAIQFFATSQTKSEIMYAAIFICSFNGICFMKVFAWGMIRKLSIKRGIKRLELRIAELSQAVNK